MTSGLAAPQSTPAFDALLGRVDVWLLDTSAISEPDEAFVGFCTDDERARFERITHPATKRNYALTRALVRTTLSRYFALESEQWRFAHGEHGRPDVTNPGIAGRLSFNASHTSDLIALACSRVQQTGVDVENPARNADIEGITKRFFSTAEHSRLSALPDESRRVSFFELWTLKEAYLKARGLGMSVPLKQAEIVPTAVGPSRFGPVLDDAGPWFFETFRRSTGHVGAVAVRGEAVEVVVLEAALGMV